MTNTKNFQTIFYVNDKPILTGENFTESLKEKSKYTFRSNWTTAEIKENDVVTCKIGENSNTLLATLILKESATTNKIGFKVLTECLDKPDENLYLWATVSYGHGKTKIFTAGVVDKRNNKIAENAEFNIPAWAV